MGYRLRPVEKTTPKKKIAETDTIFENIKRKHLKNQRDGGKRISIDCKATLRNLRGQTPVSKNLSRP